MRILSRLKGLKILKFDVKKYYFINSKIQFYHYFKFE